MVKRAGREVVTVEVFRDNYEILKKEAEQRNDTTKEFVNDMLANILSKLDYLKKIAPELSVDSYENNRITLRDAKLRRLIDVCEQGQDLFCEQDKRTDCIHTKYAWSSPEVEFSLFLSIMKDTLKSKRAEYDRQMTATVNHHHHPSP